MKEDKAIQSRLDEIRAAGILQTVEKEGRLASLVKQMESRGKNLAGEIHALKSDPVFAGSLAIVFVELVGVLKVILRIRYGKKDE